MNSVLRDPLELLYDIYPFPKLFLKVLKGNIKQSVPFSMQVHPIILLQIFHCKSCFCFVFFQIGFVIFTWKRWRLTV